VPPLPSIVTVGDEVVEVGVVVNVKIHDEGRITHGHTKGVALDEGILASGDRSHFKVLSVDRGANADAIKRAFRKLARQNHLDMNPGVTSAGERFYNLAR